jgi:hypothetical protein
MRKTKKLKKNKNKQTFNKLIKASMKGGKLQISSTDLQNLHLCQEPNGKIRESPGYELYVSIDTAFQLNDDTLRFFMTQFKKTENKWFKFVVFNDNGKDYIYIIRGAPINKHSVCLLQGLLDINNNTGEYKELSDAYEKILKIKSEKGILVDNIESNELIINLNSIINRDKPCMPVISAGSGTINEDNSICINTKSGHYKPELIDMEFAKRIFANITKKEVKVVLKVDKDALRAKYGDSVEYYSGICL